MKKISVIIMVALLGITGSISGQLTDMDKRITVDISGKGDYKSIQAALNSLTDTSAIARTIFIRNGIYPEKIYLEKHNVILLGENREKTVITQAISQDEWRCGHTDDWGVATINIDGDDITLKNLTIINSFGFDWKKTIEIPCASYYCSI